jgi:hypothetical protein
MTLTIGRFHADYFVPRGAPDPTGMAARLDRVVADRLADAAGEWLTGAGQDGSAIYRIRRLELGLYLDSSAMTDAQIGQRWAAATVAAVSRALTDGPPSEVARYDDPAHFLASYLADMMTGQAGSRWMYEEFSLLHDLTPGQAAAHLLAARPGLLIGVCKWLSRQGSLSRLIQNMQPGDVRLIWEDGLGFVVLPAIPRLDAQWDALDTALAAGLALEEGGRASLARNTLRVYLAVAMQHESLAESAALAAACYHAALLVAAWAAVPAPAVWSALAAGEISGTAALAGVLARLSSELPQAAGWLTEVLGSSAGRAYAARLASRVIPAASARPRPRLAATAFAGLALLLPPLIDLRLHERLPRHGIYQLLLAAVGSALRPLAWSDPAPAWLAGIHPAELEQARAAAVEWPDALAYGHLPPGIAEDGPAVDRLAALLLARFAARLHGFGQSTTGYIVRQFIHQPGHLALSEDTLEAHLSRMPLKVVLQMAGLDGEQGVVPWLDERRLSIVLPEG